MSTSILTQRELEEEANRIIEDGSSDDNYDLFHCEDSSDENYCPSESDKSEDDENVCSSESDNNEDEIIADDINNDDEISQEGNETIGSESVVALDGVVFWSSSSQQFSPRFCIPDEAAATSWKLKFS